MKHKPSRRRIVDSDSELVNPRGVSHRALTIARLIDRYCRIPGEYTIKLVVPYHSRGKWSVEVSRQERIRTMEIERKGKNT